MAEGLARDWIEKNQIGGLEIMSAGTFAQEGHPTSLETVMALKNLGVGFHGTSTPLTVELVDRASVVICMTNQHCDHVLMLANDTTSVELLDPTRETIDPIGCDQSVYDDLAATMYKQIPTRLEEIMNRSEFKEE
jgi:protein-tyrosine-phosphatase